MLSEREARKLGLTVKKDGELGLTVKRPKYSNRKTVVYGITFDSKREAGRYCELRLMEKAGEIWDLEVQPSFPITVNGIKICTYRADFRYCCKTGMVIEDVKGFRTRGYRLKKKLMKAVYNIDVQEI